MMQRQGGMAMVLAIIVILMLGAVIVPLAGVARQYQIDTWQAAENERSLALAEAGVAAALCEVMNEVDLGISGTGNTGIGNVAGFLGDGEFAVTIDPAYSDASAAPYTITAVGTQGDYATGMRIVIESNGIPATEANFYNWMSAYPGAVFSNQDLYVNGPRDSYSYDSLDGSSTDTERGHIRSNGDIHVGFTSSMDVNGDATPGPGGSVTLHGLPFTEVTGSTTPASSELTPPQPDLPTNPHTIPVNPHTIPSTPVSNDNAQLVGVPESVYDPVAETLTVPDWDDPTFLGGTYVLNDIYFGGGGTTITFDGDTTIHVNSLAQLTASSGEVVVNGDLTLVLNGTADFPSGWADWDIHGDFNIHVASGSSFTAGGGGPNDFIVDGDVLVNSDGAVTFGDGKVVQNGLLADGNAEFWINTGGSLTFNDWVDYTATGTLDLVADGPVIFGGAGSTMEATGDTSYYFDTNGSLTVNDGGDVNTSGKMLMVSKGPINYTSWSNINVGTDMEIYLDPGASLTYGSVSDLSMGGDFIIVSDGAPIDFGTSSDIEFSSVESTFDIYTNSTIDGGAWNTMVAGNGSPRNLRWVSTSTDPNAIIIQGPGDFYGQIYVPNGGVSLVNGPDMYGAIVADSFTMEEWSRLVFDVALEGHWETFEQNGDGGTTAEGESAEEGAMPYTVVSSTIFHP